MAQRQRTAKGKVPEAWEDLPLWQNQKDAIRRCLKYLSAPDRSALVQMPTGSGKTGIIAVLSALQSKKAPVAVVSPSRPLVDQLVADIRQNFWEHIAAANWSPVRVLTVLPSESAKLVEQLREDHSGVVLVGTFQAFAQIRREHRAEYDELAKILSLVLVDEGHREPSREWGLTIRELDHPTILFTATPYRNDLKVFNISRDHVAYLSFKDAVERKLIRDVDYSLEQASPDAKKFCQAVIAAYDQLKAKKQLRHDARVIVRCADEDRVRRLHEVFAEELANRPEKCRAIHHQFEDETDESLTSLPAIRSSDETFLVHQYKLMEGLDDSRCAMLALYDGFKSDRQFVQQLGRVLRNPTPGQSCKPAFVIATERQSAIDTWKRYLTFDEACAEQGGNPFLRNENFVEELLEQLPDQDYIQGRFRTRPDFTKKNVSEELMVPQSAIVYRVGSKFQFQELEEIVQRALDDDDRKLIRVYHREVQKCSVYFTVVATQSPLLSESTFPDLSLAVTVVKQGRDYLFLYDSAGLWIDDALNHSERLSSSRLYCLFPRGSDVKVTGLSVKNADMSRFAVRSRTVAAASLAEAVPFMGDNTNFISRANGSTPNSKRRYVGFTRSRVRDDGAVPVTIEAYSTWAELIAEELDQQAKAVRLFSRFAAPADHPDEPEPRNILLDVEEFADQFVRGNSPLRLADVCCSVDERDPQHASGKYTHDFALTVNGKACKVLIRYDKKRHQYFLKSKDLNAFVHKDNEKITLTTRLNRRQAFRVVPQERGVFYAYRQFYEIQLRLGEESTNSFVLDILSPVADLNTIASEKGHQAGQKKSWQVGSLFAFLDQVLTGKLENTALGKGFKAVVCDDMGTECADFIAMEPDEDRVVFIHAKAIADNPGVSASKLHDICAQAVKNLEFLRFGGRAMRSRVKKWGNPWKAATPKDKQQDPGYEVEPRIRRGPTDAAKFVVGTTELLGQPNTQREVWLVLGRLLSKTALEAQLSKPNPDGYALQTFFLLASTFSACKSVGVDFRVFCSK